MPTPGSRLTTITNSLLTLIAGITTAGGYNYGPYYTNQLDFNKSTFPLINLFVSDERSQDNASFPGMQSTRSTTIFELHCYNKTPSENSNNIFEIDDVLNYMLHDIKKLIGNNPTISSTVEYFGYLGSRRERSGISDDIWIPKKLVVQLEIYYSEDSKTPSTIGC